MNQVLSQAEIDALLGAVESGDVAGTGGAETAAPAKITRYNFRKPNRVSKDQVRMLHSIHESFARLHTASLTTLMRGLVEVELKSVEQVTYGEFVMSLSSPTCIVIFNMEPLKGGAALEISANVLFRFIDRLLGGTGLLAVRLREFTEVEQVLIERVAVRAMMDLQQTWQHAGTFGFRVAHLETNPQFVQLTSPNEVVIVVTFDVKTGEESGLLTLAFPHLLLEPVIARLNTQRYFATSQRDLSPEEGQELKANVLRIGMGIRGVLAEVPISIRELMALKPGSVLSLHRAATAPATVELEGVPRFTGRPGTVNRRKALRLLSVIPKGEVIRDAGDSAGRARVYTP